MREVMKLSLPGEECQVLDRKRKGRELARNWEKRGSGVEIPGRGRKNGGPGVTRPAGWAGRLCYLSNSVFTLPQVLRVARPSLTSVRLQAGSPTQVGLMGSQVMRAGSQVSTKGIVVGSWHCGSPGLQVCCSPQVNMPASQVK